jgi:hypothetical protein
MELLWFYIAITLAISDEIHSKLMWNIFNNFYVIFAGIIKELAPSNLVAWIIHEIIEAVFHTIILSIIFLSFEIGLLAGIVHFTIDITHSFFADDMNPIEHRSLHFVIESLFFMLIFGF